MGVTRAQRQNAAALRLRGQQKATRRDQAISADPRGFQQDVRTGPDSLLGGPKPVVGFTRFGERELVRIQSQEGHALRTGPSEIRSRPPRAHPHEPPVTVPRQGQTQQEDGGGAGVERLAGRDFMHPGQNRRSRKRAVRLPDGRRRSPGPLKGGDTVSERVERHNSSLHLPKCS